MQDSKKKKKSAKRRRKLLDLKQAKQLSSSELEKKEGGQKILGIDLGPTEEKNR